MAKVARTAEVIVAEYIDRGRNLDEIHALGVAINRIDVLELIKQRKEASVLAYVSCKGNGCEKLIPFGQERMRGGKCYCTECYRKEFLRAKVQDSEVVATGPVLEASEVPGRLQGLPEPGPEEQEVPSDVQPAGSEEGESSTGEEATGGSEEKDSGGGDEVEVNFDSSRDRTRYSW